MERYDLAQACVRNHVRFFSGSGSSHEQNQYTQSGYRTSKMAQLVKAPATNLSLVPRIHMVEEENPFPQMFFDLHMHYGMLVRRNTQQRENMQIF